MAKVCVCDGLEIVDGCLGVNITEDPCSALAMVAGALSVPGIDRFDKDPQLLSTLGYGRLDNPDVSGSGDLATTIWGETLEASITNHSDCRRMWTLTVCLFQASMDLDSGRMYLVAERARNDLPFAEFWSREFYSADKFGTNVHDTFIASFGVLEPGATLKWAMRLGHGRSHGAVNARLAGAMANLNLFGILG